MYHFPQGNKKNKNRGHTKMNQEIVKTIGMWGTVLTLVLSVPVAAYSFSVVFRNPTTNDLIKQCLEKKEPQQCIDLIKILKEGERR